MTTATATTKTAAKKAAAPKVTKAAAPAVPAVPAKAAKATPTTELPALTEAKLAALTKNIEKFLVKEETVNLTRRSDAKVFTGKLVRREDGNFSVRTGQRGRPVSLSINEIAQVTRVTV